MWSAIPGTVRATTPCSGAWTSPLAIGLARAGPKLLGLVISTAVQRFTTRS